MKECTVGDQYQCGSCTGKALVQDKEDVCSYTAGAKDGDKCTVKSSGKDEKLCQAKITKTCSLEDEKLGDMKSVMKCVVSEESACPNTCQYTPSDAGKKGDKCTVKGSMPSGRMCPDKVVDETGKLCN